ncbi:DUF2398 family protein [Actinoplanes xinjiangensis]|uniref:Uncharacterized protein (TIGR02678 family) n=1 Tax=Actinoplanes xinjiangensis TaxID=512350 RepID=A0A316EHV1_9ACTN|nr:DUF2398 family protein [Actinoplanes xinjiangensis]PWK30794.1 uncharacterized protein (TIGR02678 family) [Actinoplanes xinjiangensis]GIF44240.1 hypothetical protein Axi01nite_85510 [Actinoplanes xinjiangensis]
MTERPMLDPDLADAARHLLLTCRISSAQDPLRYRAVLRGRRELTDFFRAELGWGLHIHDVSGVVRLHKRRDDVPGDRGPRLQRRTGRGDLAPAQVLVLAALVCEQLWRRPRISLRELLQSVAQVCAAEAGTGRLPAFRIVAAEGVGKRQAQAAREDIVDAIKLLQADGEISVDADLDRAVTDENAEVFITADRDSLANKFASLSPTLLALGNRPIDQHVAALTAVSLPDTEPDAVVQRQASVEGRRLTALRRVVDDPAADPGDDPNPVGYLATSTGRERALNVASSLGLVTTVRRDWWEVVDPTGTASDADFPQGRKTERQGALALLSHLPYHDAIEISADEILTLFDEVRQDMPRWAAGYAERLPALVRAAATELVTVGLLRQTGEDRWQILPGVHLWRIRVRQGQAGPEGRHRATSGDDNPATGGQENQP